MYNPACLIVGLLLNLSAMTFAAGAPVASGQQVKKPNYVGAYLYTDRFIAAAEEQNRDFFELFDEHFKKLADVGVNCIHITIHDPQLFDRYVELAVRHNIMLLPELDFAYFQAHWTDEEMLQHARKATDFLRVWHDNPQVIAWSIKEEPYDDDIEKLDRYYRLIVKEVPKVKFFLVTSGGGWLTANAADLPFALVGGDYYYFSWEQGLAEKAYARAPRQALSESRSTTELYRRASEKFGVDRIHVFGAAACTIPDRAQGFATGTALPQSWTQEQKDAYTRTIKRLAEKGRDGWTVYNDVPGKEGPQYNLWTLYMPPENCIRALIWGGILEGAKVTMCFSYDPYSRKYNPDSPLDAVQNYRTERFYVDLAVRPGTPNQHFEEFAETVGEVRSYDNILPCLTIRSTTPLEREIGHDLFARAFEIEGFDGEVLIVHNANVGYLLCPECKGQSLQSCEHVFIDDHGELKYFVPQTKSNTANLTLAKSAGNISIFDIATGEPLQRNGRAYLTDIQPGGAKLLYVGTRETANAIHRLYLPERNPPNLQ